jgi:hypothetical protein
MCKTRLRLVVADLVVPGNALFAAAAAANEWHRNPIALAPAGDVSANRRDRTGEFVTRHVRQRDVCVMPHPAVPVAPTHTSCFHLYHGAGFRRRWVFDSTDIDRATKFLVNRSSHQVTRVLYIT